MAGASASSRGRLVSSAVGPRDEQPEDREGADPGRVEDPELRPREERDRDRAEECELAEDRRALQCQGDRVDGPRRREVGDALGHHGGDRDRRGDRHRERGREHGPPGAHEPACEQVHGHGRQGEEERVRGLEPVVGSVDAPREPEDRREHDARRARSRSPRRAGSAPRPRRARRRRSGTAPRPGGRGVPRRPGRAGCTARRIRRRRGRGRAPARGIVPPPSVPASRRTPCRVPTPSRDPSPRRADASRGARELARRYPRDPDERQLRRAPLCRARAWAGASRNRRTADEGLARSLAALRPR